MFTVLHEINPVCYFPILSNNFFIIQNFPWLFDDIILSIDNQFTIIIFSVNGHIDLSTIALIYEPTNYN